MKKQSVLQRELLIQKRKVQNNKVSATGKSESDKKDPRLLSHLEHLLGDINVVVP